MEIIEGMIMILFFGVGMCVASIIWIWVLHKSLQSQKEKLKYTSSKKGEESG